MLNMKNALLLALVLLVGPSSQAQSQGHTRHHQIRTLRSVCFPKNKLHLLDQINGPTNVTEEQFHKIIDNAVAYYQPIVKKHGAELKANKLWTNGTVNASAQQNGNTWIINMYGGLARRPEVTPDGFALVVCHEIGHHLGGYSFYGDDDWAAAEGQADYFSTHACAKAIWSRSQGKNAKSRHYVDSFAKKACDTVYGNQAERDLCYRRTEGGQSLANLLAKLGNSPLPKYETPDASRVSHTDVSHPQAQCRLDTYLMGTLCTKDFDGAMIPARDPKGGQTSIEAEKEAMKYSCMIADGYKVGYRPMCWFKPLIGGSKNYRRHHAI